MNNTTFFTILFCINARSENRLQPCGSCLVSVCGKSNRDRRQGDTQRDHSGTITAFRLDLVRPLLLPRKDKEVRVRKKVERRCERREKKYRKKSYDHRARRNRAHLVPDLARVPFHLSPAVFCFSFFQKTLFPIAIICGCFSGPLNSAIDNLGVFPSTQNSQP